MKPFKAIDWGTGNIQLHNALEMRPIELHHKSDGDIDSNPSFVILMTSVPEGAEEVLHAETLLPRVYGQISLKMLNDGLKTIGYKITKLNSQL